MKLRYARILSLLLCAALACSILAGCGGSTASSSEAPSSASSSASSAASGEDLPDSTTRADTSGLASRTPEAVQEAFYSWYDTLDTDEQESFAEAWTMIEPDALSLLSDKDSMAGRIEDAGLDPDTLPGCTLKNWQALQTVLDDCVPTAGQ